MKGLRGSADCGAVESGEDHAGWFYNTAVHYEFAPRALSAAIPQNRNVILAIDYNENVGDWETWRIGD